MKKKEDARNVEKTRFPVKFDPNLGVSPRCLAAYHGILNWTGVDDGMNEGCERQGGLL